MSGSQKVFGGPILGQLSAVATSLPLPYKLGLERIESNGDVYKLFHNTCNQQISKGFAFARNTGSAAGAGPYSATLTTVTEVAYNAAGMVVHSTATTGSYFWGLVKNVASAVAYVGGTALATPGTYMQVAANGVFTNGTTQAVGYSVATNVTAVLGGSTFVDFTRQFTQ